MEEKKKHIEIRIKMDENEQITPNSKISNVSGDDVITCYLAGAVYIANIIADSSNGVYDAKQALDEITEEVLDYAGLKLANEDET